MTTQQSFVNLFQSIRVRLKLFLSSVVPPDEVEDIVQETYIKIWQQHKDQPIPINKGFIFTVAKNMALDFLRKPHVKKTHAVEHEAEYGVDSEDSTYAEAESSERFLVFCEAVRQLPPQCRKIFILRKVYGMKIKEIAAELSLSSRTVEVQLQRGYVKFQHLVNLPTASHKTTQHAPQDGTDVYAKR